MVELAQIGFKLSAALFLGTAAWDWLARTEGWNLSVSPRWGLRLGWFVLTASLAALGVQAFGSPAAILATIAWGAAGLALFLDLTFDHRLPPWLVGLISGLALLAAAFLSLQAGDRQPWTVLHVAAAILAYCLLVAQALNAAVYLLQHRALTTRQFGGIYADLDPLVALDRVGSQLLGAAIWMLGLVLTVGAVAWFQGFQASLPKLLSAFATWGLGSVVLMLRRRGRLSGASFAKASLLLLLPAAAALFLALDR
jgi:ABC-type uncharacterized transport system permease subunit